MININANIIGRQSGGGGGGQIHSAFKSYVLQDGGTIADEEWIKLRMQHAKDNGYLDKVVSWCSPCFGYKGANGFASVLYSVINPATNSLIQDTGSRRPELVVDELTSKLVVRGDGVDDVMATSHNNVLIPSDSEIFLVTVFRALAAPSSGDSSKNWFVGDKSGDTTGIVGFRENTDISYRSAPFKRTDTMATGLAFGYLDPNGPGSASQIGKWHILVHSMNETDSFIIWNNQLFWSQVYNGTVTQGDLKGLMLFNTGPSDTRITKCCIAENLLIHGRITRTLAQDIVSIINDYYGIF